MQECIGRYFIRNAELLECSEFDPCYLDDPYYIYEVFRVINGVALFIEDHYQRLKFTASHWGLPPGIIPSDFYRKVDQLIEASQINEGNIKIVIHQKLGDDCETVFLIFNTEHQYPSPEQFLLGVQASLLKGVRVNPNAKVMDVSLRNKANIIKQEHEVYETLLVDSDNCITEGSRSNVFFIKDNLVITPPLADVLPGVTRKHVMEVCSKNNIQVVEAKVPVKDLPSLDAAFISGTSRKVLPLHAIDHISFDFEHLLIRKIQELFNHKVQDYINDKKSSL